MSLPQIASLVRDLLTDLGEDVSRDGLQDTPQRVAKAHMDAMAGYACSSSSVIGDAIFHEPLASRGCGGTVLVRDIDFASTCEDTLMPFHGRCHVAYLPADESVLGLSKLARLVQAFSKRLCSQHELTQAIQQAVAAHVPCMGVFVQMRARHLACAVEGSTTVTEACSGCYNKPGSLHAKEARMLLTLGVQDPPYMCAASSTARAQPDRKSAQQTGTEAGVLAAQSDSPDTSPCSHSSSPLSPSTPSDSTNASHATTLDFANPVHDGMVETVERIYTLLLEASGQKRRISPAAAARFVSVLRRQTLGYTQTLEQVVARHAFNACGAHDPPMPPFCALVCAQEPSQLDATLSEYSAAEVRPQLRGGILQEKFLEDSGAGDSATCAASEVTTGASMCTGSESVRAESEADSMSSGGVALGRLVMGVPVPSAGCQCCTSTTPGHSLSSYASDCSGLVTPHAWQAHLEGRAHSCIVQFPSNHHDIRAPDGGASIQGNTGGAVAVASAQVWSVKFATQCEHHMLPFYGVMHFALQRGCSVAPELTAACVCELVALYSCRLQVQERLAQQVADALHVATGGADVVLVCSAAHMCMVARGVERHAAETLSTAARGQVENSPEERSVWLERLLECVQKREVQ